jgi:hypothetical protein
VPNMWSTVSLRVLHSLHIGSAPLPLVLLRILSAVQSRFYRIK